MRGICSLLWPFIGLLLLSSNSFAADNVIVSDNTGKAYLKDNSGNLFPAGVVFTTDGNSNIQPVFSTNSTISIGTVNQGTSNNGSSPWYVQDTAFKSSFDLWKTWADVNLSTRASDSTLSTFSGKFTNTTGGAIKTDGSAFTQPVSGSVSVTNFPASQNINGTVTANIGTTGSLALDSTSQTISTAVTKLPIAQGTTLGSNSQVMVGASVTTSSPSYANGLISPLTQTTAGALRTDSSATTQPISGTITANAGTGNFNVVQSTGTNLHTVIDSGTITSNIGTTNGLALDSSVAKLNIPQGTAIGSNTQVLIGGSVSTASPAYTTGQIDPLSLTTAGALRVDASSTTQPVSGTVAATQSGNWSTRSQDGNGNLLTSQLSGSQRALDIGVNVSGVQIDPRSIRALTSSDVVTANIGTTNGLALDTSVNGILVSQGSTTSGEKGPLIQGAVTTSSPTYTTAQTSPLSLTTSGALRVDASSTTQPVSGTVTANAGTGTFTVGQATGTNLHTVVDSGSIAATQSGTWNINNVSGTVSLPTGAATSANQTTANTSLATIATNTTGVSTSANQTNGTQKTQVVDSSNNSVATVSLVTGSSTGNNFLGAAVNQYIFASTNNSSTANINSGASFTGSADLSTSQAVVEVNFFADQPVTIQVQQSSDGTHWDVSDSYTVAASTGDSRTFQLLAYYYRIIVTNNGGSATTAVRLQSGLIPIANPLPRALTQLGNLKVSVQEPLVAASTANTSSVSALSTDHRPPQAATYAAYSAAFTPAATASDFCTITGSGTKTVRILGIEISGTSTGGAESSVFIVKRSTANTGGTSTSLTAVPYDSNSAAATATAVNYTANPTTGNLVGTIRNSLNFFSTVTAAGAGMYWNFDTSTGSQIVLRGTSQQVSLNFNGAAIPTGASFRCGFTWLEE